MLDQLKNDKSFFLEILKILKEESFEHYDIEEDYEGLHRWLEDSKKFIKLETINISKVTEYSSLLLVVEKIISLYKEYIEKHDMWRMFWTKNYSKFNHVKEFYSQMLFYMVYHTWLSSQLSKVYKKENLHPQTVRIWIKEVKLQVISSNPILINGGYIKEFLRNRNHSHSKKLLFKKFKCLKCKKFMNLTITKFP